MIVALYRINIENCDEKVTTTSQFKEQYNWWGAELPVAFSKTEKFKKNSSDIVVNICFTGKNSIYTVPRSEFNGKCKKQVNLLMVIDGKIGIQSREKYVVIVNFTGCQKNEQYCYYVKFLNSFRTESTRGKH